MLFLILNIDDYVQNFYKHKRTITLAILVYIIQEVHLQEFSNSCNDAIIKEHLDKFQHTYCHHACGFLDMDSPNSRSSCDLQGNCICEYPCLDKVPSIAPTFQGNFGSSLCPAEDLQPDSMSSQICTLSCSLQCPGGLGIICRETNPQLITAKICTCFCPPQPCSYNALLDLKNGITNPLALAILLIKKIKFDFLLRKFLFTGWVLIIISLTYFLKSTIVFWSLWSFYSVLEWWYGLGSKLYESIWSFYENM